MFKKKFKATLINKDAATDIMYHTSQAIKLENNNFTIFISNDKKMMQKANLAEHQSIKASNLSSFKLKLFSKSMK